MDKINKLTDKELCELYSDMDFTVNSGYCSISTSDCKLFYKIVDEMIRRQLPIKSYLPIYVLRHNDKIVKVYKEIWEIANWINSEMSLIEDSEEIKEITEEKIEIALKHKLSNEECVFKMNNQNTFAITKADIDLGYVSLKELKL